MKGSWHASSSSPGGVLGAAVLALTLAGCGADPLEAVRDTTRLCGSEEAFAQIVAANVAEPTYEVSDRQGDRYTVTVTGRVAYLGQPVRVEVAGTGDGPARFSVITGGSDGENDAELVGLFCAGELPLAPDFGAAARVAERVARARQLQESIARMILIEEIPPDELPIADSNEPFDVLEGAVLVIPLSDIFLGLTGPVIHIVPGLARKSLYFSCRTNLPYQVYPLLEEACQNPLQ